MWQPHKRPSQNDLEKLSGSELCAYGRLDIYCNCLVTAPQKHFFSTIYIMKNLG